MCRLVMGSSVSVDRFFAFFSSVVGKKMSANCLVGRSLYFIVKIFIELSQDHILSTKLGGDDDKHRVRLQPTAKIYVDEAIW